MSVQSASVYTCLRRLRTLCILHCIVLFSPQQTLSLILKTSGYFTTNCNIEDMTCTLFRSLIKGWIRGHLMSVCLCVDMLSMCCVSMSRAFGSKPPWSSLQHCVNAYCRPSQPRRPPPRCWAGYKPLTQPAWTQWRRSSPWASTRSSPLC